MKKSIRTMTASAFIAGLMLTSCNTPTEKVDNAKENVIEAKKRLSQSQ
jgi:hypothetical protein